MPKRYLIATVTVAVVALVVGAVTAPNLATVAAIPLIAVAVLSLVAWLARQRWGWIGLLALWVWAIGGGIALWIGTSWRPADSAPPRTNWIDGASGWLLVVYFLVVVWSLGAIRLVGDAESRLHPRWRIPVFALAAVAVLLFQIIFSLHEYNYPS